MNFRIFLVASVIVTACGGSKPQPQNDPRFERLEARLKALEEQAAQGKGAGEGDPQTLEQIEHDMDEAVTGGATKKRSQVRAVPVAGSPAEGPEHAWVTIVEGYEYACPYCDHVRATLDQLRKEYGADLRVVYKHFIVHSDVAMPSALAACAAHAQGKFSEMNNLIWTVGFARRNINQEQMMEFAKQLKLKLDKFKKDIEGICPETIRRDQAELAVAGGATGTPTFFINGRPIQGAMPIENFRILIDEELKRAKNSGVAKQAYYQHVMDSVTP